MATEMQLVNGAQTLQENVHKDRVNIVWLKRDLRLSDHEPLAESTQAEIGRASCRERV